MKDRIVEVTWVDSCGWSQWAKRAEHSKGHVSQCKTAGYLLSQDKKQVVIALNLSGEGNADSSITIPRSCVKRVRRIE